MTPLKLPLNLPLLSAKLQYPSNSALEAIMLSGRNLQSTAAILLQFKHSIPQEFPLKFTANCP